MTSFSAALVAHDRLLRDAMAAIDRGGTGIALVVGEDGQLVGILTDGDIRRALLAGAAMHSPLAPHVVTSFLAVAPGASRGEVLELMQARRITQVPVVEADGTAVGLHLLHEMVGVERRPNWAVVMAGGPGTRLRPLTDTIPKPMLRVAGRPILERIVFHLVSHGIDQVFLAVNYLGDVIEQHFGDGSRFGCRIAYLRESVPLGTAGALTLLPERPAHPIVVLNGDLVTQADIGALLDLHDARGNACTVGIGRYVHTVPFGTILRSGEAVTAIEEKPTIEREINAGIYAVSPEVTARIQPGRPISMPEVLAEAIQRGDRVGTFTIGDDWIDIGRHEQLEEARRGS